MNLPAVPSALPWSNDEIDTIARVVKAVGDTEFVPKGLRGRPGAILGAILYGRELGMGPMVSLAEIADIDGTPTLSAAATLGRIRAAGHSVEFQEGEGQCIAVGRRADNGDEHTTVWTLADAETAGLLNRPAWRAYPRAMLRARAVTELARALFSDSFAGLAVYTAEELGAEAAADSPLPPQLAQGQQPGEAGSEHHPEAAGEDHPNPEAWARAQARGAHWALVNELDDGSTPPPSPAHSWADWSKAEAARRFNVATRADLTAEQWATLRRAIADAHHDAAGVPFG